MLEGKERTIRCYDALSIAPQFVVSASWASTSGRVSRTLTRISELRPARTRPRLPKKRPTIKRDQRSRTAVRMTALCLRRAAENGRTGTTVRQSGNETVLPIEQVIQDKDRRQPDNLRPTAAVVSTTAPIFNLGMRFISLNAAESPANKQKRSP